MSGAYLYGCDQCCGSWFFPSLIPGSRNNKKECGGGDYGCCFTFFVDINFTKFTHKETEPIDKEFQYFFPKKLDVSSKKYGLGIRDPRSGIRKKLIPDPGVKKAPKLGSPTLVATTKLKVHLTSAKSMNPLGGGGEEGEGGRDSITPPDTGKKYFLSTQRPPSIPLKWKGTTMPI